MMRGYADDRLSRQGRDCMNHRLARNTLAKVLENRFLEAPFLDPVLRKIQVRYGHGAAAVRSIHEGDRAGPAATNGFRTRGARERSGIQHNTGKPVKGRPKKVRLGSAGSTIDMAFGVDVERCDTALIVSNRRRHPWQGRWECHHDALANKLVGEFVLVSLDLGRIGIESGFCLHRAALIPTSE